MVGANHHGGKCAGGLSAMPGRDWPQLCIAFLRCLAMRFVSKTAAVEFIVRG